MKKAGAAIVAFTVFALLLGACSSSPSGPPTTAGTPQYQNQGSYQVGVTTLDLGSAGSVLGERYATGFYPSSLSAKQAASMAKFSYAQAQTIPTALQGILPAKYNTVTTIDAYADAPSSPKGPFPVILFSHGYGGERLYYSHLLAGMASWGYVIVSADYLERGIAAQALSLKTVPSSRLDQSIMASSLSVLLSANDTASSVLHGIVNPKRVATVGHSAGGGTALTALNVPAVKTAVGWAPVPPSGTPVAKPVMLIGAEGDNAVPPSSVEKTYGSFTGPKSWIKISGEGHDSYTDTCAVIRGGGGLISFALANHFVTPELANLAINGCQAKNIAPQRFWPIVQYYTLFQIATVFSGHNKVVPIPAAGVFSGFSVKIVQHGT